jgi:hypothetical protein
MRLSNNHSRAEKAGGNVTKNLYFADPNKAWAASNTLKGGCLLMASVILNYAILEYVVTARKAIAKCSLTISCRR